MAKGKQIFITALSLPPGELKRAVAKSIALDV